MKRILVVAAHPDDAELGAGAALSLWAGHAGADISIVNLCDRGDPATVAEARKAALMLSPQARIDISFGGLPHRRIARRRKELLDLLESLRRDLDPDVVITHAPGDLHQDHVAALDECRRAFKDRTLLTMAGVRSNRVFRPKMFIQVGSVDVARKTEAASCYKTERAKVYMLPRFIEAKAVYFGAMAGCSFAEAFGIEWAIGLEVDERL